MWRSFRKGEKQLGWAEGLRWLVWAVGMKQCGILSIMRRLSLMRSRKCVGVVEKAAKRWGTAREWSSLCSFGKGRGYWRPNWPAARKFMCSLMGKLTYCMITFVAYIHPTTRFAVVTTHTCKQAWHVAIPRPAFPAVFLIALTSPWLYCHRLHYIQYWK